MFVNYFCLCQTIKWSVCFLNKTITSTVSIKIVQTGEYSVTSLFSTVKVLDYINILFWLLSALAMWYLCAINKLNIDISSTTITSNIMSLYCIVINAKWEKSNWGLCFWMNTRIAHVTGQRCSRNVWGENQFVTHPKTAGSVFQS